MPPLLSENSQALHVFAPKYTRKNSLKYFYIYIHGVGKHLSDGPRQESFKIVSDFSKAVTGAPLNESLCDCVDIPLFPYFYNILCEAGQILHGEDFAQRQKIYHTMIMRIYLSPVYFQ